MSDISNQLLGQIGHQGIQDISRQIGADEDQTTRALSGIIPTLLGAMATNSKTESGANGIFSALDSDHDGSILDNITDFIGNYNQGPGEGILRHVLGRNQPVVESGLSAKTGLDSSQISKLLKIAAPLIMGYLGREKRTNNNQGFDLGSISDLLGGLTRESDQSTGLDLGDILNVVGGLTDNKTQRSGGIGGLLGKLFGR